MPLFDSDFLSKLEYLSIVSKRVFQGRLIAQRRTRQLGAGIEFADHREYAHGDDFRYLDWNVYARHEQLLLKRFHEEEDLHVYVMLDCSRSMGFGSPPKFDHARRVAAALAYIALADLDRVSVVAFADGVLADLPMTRGKGRILSLLQFLEQQELRGADTDLHRAATQFVRRRQRSGPVILVSDFYDPRGFRRGVDLLRYHRFEPHVVHVYDPAEAEPTTLGDVEFVDAETGALRKVTVTEAGVRHYCRLYEQFVAEMRTYCRAYGLSLTRASTSVAFDDLVLRMMRQTEVVA